MRSMRLLFVFALLAIVPLSALAAAPQYIASPGSYSLAPMTEWDKIRNDDRSPSLLPLLVAKPGELTDALNNEERAAATYAFIKLGTAQQGIYVAFGRLNSNNVDFLYVDANNNKLLEAAERVELKKESPFSSGVAEIQWTEVIKPIPCTISYARSDGTLTTRRLTLQFHFLRYTMTSSGRNSSSVTKYVSYYVVNTWFTGTGRFKTGKDEKEMSFAILDGNDNGVFNDYGRDVMLVDANGDGQFDMEKEMVQLLEFDETKLDSKTVAQNRKVMFAWPTTLFVKPAKETIDWTAIEPN